MKGIILAGGTGTRLLPATRVTNKHLIPIIERPMILYPLETLQSFGIQDIMVITGGNHIGDIEDFLGDGSEYGVRMTYRVQRDAGGIAQALGLAKEFVAGDRSMVILGDNIFDSKQLQQDIGPFHPGDHAFFCFKQVDDPSRFAVPTFDADGRLVSMVEKPQNPPTPYAHTGLYSYPPDVFDVIPTLTLSGRGELEITDVNKYYIAQGRAEYCMLSGFWSDAGTPRSLYETTVWAGEQRKEWPERPRK